MKQLVALGGDPDPPVYELQQSIFAEEEMVVTQADSEIRLVFQEEAQLSLVTTPGEVRPLDSSDRDCLSGTVPDREDRQSDCFLRRKV